MKKLIALLLALVMVLGLAACGAPAAAPAEKAVKVGIAAPDVTHGWVAGVAYYAETTVHPHSALPISLGAGQTVPQAA